MFGFGRRTAPFIFHCVLYNGEHRQLLSKIEARYNGFLSLDIQCLTWLGKYQCDAFEIRNRYIASISDGNVLWADVYIHRSRFATCLASWKKVYIYWSVCMYAPCLSSCIYVCILIYLLCICTNHTPDENSCMPVPLWEEVECLQIV